MDLVSHDTIRYRIYLNSLDQPQPWSIDEGDISTRSDWDHILVRVSTSTGTDFSQPSNSSEPSAWMACDGRLRELSSSPRIAIIE